MKKTLLIAGIAVIVALVVFTMSNQRPVETSDDTGTIPPAPVLSGNTIAVLPQVSSAAVGDEVKVDIVSNDVSGVFGVQISVRYDDQVFEFVDAAEGTFLNRNGAEQTLALKDVMRTNTPGLVKDFVLVKMGDEGTSGSGVIGTLTFRAKSAGNAEFSISDASISNAQAKPITVLTQGSRISVG